MANLGDANGTLSVDRDFFYKYKSIIEEADHQYSGEYSIFLTNPVSFTIDNFIDDGEKVNFPIAAATRWCMESTVIYPSVWGAEDSAKWKEVLLKEEPTFILDYDEYECGMEILAHELTEIKFMNANGELEISCNVMEHEDYEYNDRKRIELGFEEGISSDQLLNDSYLKDFYEDSRSQIDITFEEFVEVLKKHLKSDEYDGYICYFKVDESLLEELEIDKEQEIEI